ncbi:MAG: molybdopterin synthase catalytic subunit MoaE [Pseudohongiellaceae bacterium]
MISVQTEDFDLAKEYESLREVAGDPGAIVTFSGLVREFYDKNDQSNDTVKTLYLEHYPGMTERSLAKIVSDAKARWPIQACKVIHRVGELGPKEQIVFVGTASAHRHAAFESAMFIMDFLKSRAPFWKKQRSEAGSEWIASRKSDAKALQRWDSENT